MSVRSPAAPPATRPAPSTTPATPSLTDVASGRGTLSRGAHGESVRQLQEALNARGANLTADGDFGPETQAAVRRFQQQSGARVDGVVGPETMGKLNGAAPASPSTKDTVERGPSPGGTPRAPTEARRRQQAPGSLRAGDLQRTDQSRRPAPAGGVTPTLAPAGASEAERYAHYSRIIEANGGQVNPDGQPTVLGLRGLSRDGTAHDTTSSRQYDDTFVVLTRDAGGNPHVREFHGATHPGQRGSTSAPDVTGDHVGDVGMIRPGNYNVVPNGAHGGNASYHVRTEGGSGRLPGWRDTNHDGRFSDAERTASQNRGDTLTAVLFHQGGTTAPRSIGCQTLAPNEYQQFIDTLGGPRARFNYTLVNGG